MMPFSLSLFGAHMLTSQNKTFQSIHGQNFSGDDDKAVHYNLSEHVIHGIDLQKYIQADDQSLHLGDNIA